jgi:adenine-specific DNA-methyltransferase
MELESRDLLAQKREELKAILPEIFDDGVLNIDKFKTIFAPQSDEKSEHYSFTWNGKKECYQTIRQKSNATLKLDPSHSELDSESNSNVFIEGDNLEVLKLLQTSYHKKIKMIYIDPPYNKDKDFVYKDTWGDTITNYLIQTDQLREEGYTSTKTSSTGRRHTNWLNMIYPRLWLSRNLLKDDGVIFVSIDDDEVHNLRKVMDEIYGEENFVTQIIWKSRQNKDNRSTTGASVDHEYILCYSKNEDVRALKGSERKIEQYKNPDKDPRGLWTSGNMVGLLPENLRPNCHYDLIDPETGINYGKPKMGWRYDKNTMQKLIAEKRILWPNTEEGRPRRKVFLEELTDALAGFSSVISDEIYTRHGTAEIEELFEFRPFDFPKPSLLIKQFIKQATEEDDIILDFFAGSGTTAHAVMAQNLEDGGNRKYILVQLPEATEENSEAYKAGYRKISDITKERIKRVIQKLDYKAGFKSYVLDNSNFQIFKEVKKRPGESIESIEKMLKMSMFHENILTQGAKKLDIVYEIGLKNGFTLSANYEEFKKGSYSFIRLFEENREFFFTFDKKIEKDIRECVPQGAKLICYDKSLDDSTKLNLREYFALETL